MVPTISNCTIGKCTKKWGLLICSASNNPNGVYTFSNCIFDGTGHSTQGLYINEKSDGAGVIYNIENCIFTGPFDAIEGAIAIQNGDKDTTSDCSYTINVTGCTFDTENPPIVVLYESFTGLKVNAPGVTITRLDKKS